MGLVIFVEVFVRIIWGLEIGELDFNLVEGEEIMEDEKFDDDWNKGFEKMGEIEEWRSWMEFGVCIERIVIVLDKKFD